MKLEFEVTCDAVTELHNRTSYNSKWVATRFDNGIPIYGYTNTRKWKQSLARETRCIRTIRGVQRLLHRAANIVFGDEFAKALQAML
jgi:hypothetical protein